MTTAFRVHELERATSVQSLTDFLSHVVIPDPPPMGVGSIAFAPWPHILRLHNAAEAVAPGGTLPVLKARKLGVTSYFEARFVHHQYQKGAFLPVISQGEDEAKKVIRECKFIWEHLPEHLQVDIRSDNATTLEFVTGTRIEAFPSTAKAGRSYTGTEILFDEADFHEVFEASYNALLPLIQDSGGRMFIVSTANPDLVDSAFRRIYLNAPNRLFLGYYDRPNRTEEGYSKARDLSSDDARFEKENPLTEAEALAPPRSRAYFDNDAVSALMEEHARPPSREEGPLRIWKPAGTGFHYVLGADTAWGVTGSYNAACVLEHRTGEQVAELHGRLSPNEMAYEVWQLHKTYNHAYMGLERAGEGQERDGESVVVVDKVLELLRGCGCSGRLYYHDHDAKDPQVPGWQTDGKTRPVLLGDFREAVRERQTSFHSREMYHEMLFFIRNEKGRQEAATGAHDDRIVAGAIAWRMRNEAHFSLILPPRQPLRRPASWSGRK